MKNTLKKGLSLGIGLALTSKEQAQKVLDELVKKGELSQQESKEFYNEIWERGQETQQELEGKIQQKLNKVLNDLNVATKEDISELEKRLEQLENQNNNQ
ncbi:Polyhydroxyalkanoate synthesis regulator phasin [Salinibacillus kushneri]|uniref:Polyhydroxyalkanoate synthesis regulator phasin n=1 Tax=Salinibacillus kushneri TaxID=237682 RepID=A0A1I0ABN0_9BACI|nr:phasin family protein [Salinibacillus kushneri]SES91626.1 Polyhydroxyalkanoate synthesis regulator phasin [Salinibacillus kushneri]